MPDQATTCSRPNGPTESKRAKNAAVISRMLKRARKLNGLLKKSKTICRDPEEEISKRAACAQVASLAQRNPMWLVEDFGSEPRRAAGR